MQLNDLNNKQVAILGFGQEGRATAEYLLKHGVTPVLFDERPWEEFNPEDQQYIKSLNVNFIFGPQAFLELKGFDVGFRSPGIQLVKIKDKGIRTITSQTKFFFDNSPSKIIGVTGTKGKGTTASLIHKLLEANVNSLKAKSYLTGNIGKVQPFEILDNLKPEDWVVYELSSFQLQDLQKSPHIGVILMVTSEHLDYHKDLHEYLNAKTAIVKYQTLENFAVINSDFPNSVKIGEQGQGQKFYFSRQNQLKSGIYLYNSHLIVKNFFGQNFEIPLTNFQLRGAHNLENIFAAVAAAICAGCDPKTIQPTVENFKGLEHRLEFVAQKRGIKFYNDSFSTTPETAIAALRSFTEPVIVILGGSSKNSDFTELGRSINEAKNIKAVILIGEETKKIKNVINPGPQILEAAKSMAEIFTQIKSIAAKNDVVLLSPACASFDMFKNYIDRGEQFKSFVQNF